MRSVNAAFGLQSYNLAFLNPPEGILPTLQADFKTQVEYYNDTTVVNKGMPLITRLCLVMNYSSIMLMQMFP